jgi:hypothetical protein
LYVWYNSVTSLVVSTTVVRSASAASPSIGHSESLTHKRNVDRWFGTRVDSSRTRSPVVIGMPFGKGITMSMPPSVDTVTKVIYMWGVGVGVGVGVVTGVKNFQFGSDFFHNKMHTNTLYTYYMPSISVTLDVSQPLTSPAKALAQ